MASELIKFVKNGNIKAVADMINIDPDLLNARDKVKPINVFAD
jgi:hypothetical protein